MRLNRKWLYLGGLVTILTLLLTLTLALPAGAVGTLDRGSVSTDVDYVSPDTKNLTDVDDRTVEATLTNSDLDITKTVKDDGDYRPVEIEVNTAIDPVAHPTILINILGGTSTGAEADGGDAAARQGMVTINIPSSDNKRHIMPIMEAPPDGGAPVFPGHTYAAAVANILPITGDFTIDFAAGGSSAIRASSLGTPRVVNAVNGLIEIPVRATLPTTGRNQIVLSYNTSPQETALMNVEGDHDDFDLLGVESPAGPYGEYSNSFVVAETVTITLDGRDDDGIHDEQHTVDGGLQSNISIEDEEIVARYWRYQDAANEPVPSRRLDCAIEDDSAYPSSSSELCTTPDADSSPTATAEGFPNPVNQGRIPGTLATNNAGTIASRLTDDTEDGDAREGTTGDAEQRTFYIQVENPPIRDDSGMGIATDSNGITLEDSDRFVFVTGNTGSDPTGPNLQDGLVDAVRGILRVRYIGDDPLEVDEPVEISYRGSDDFFITVDRGPIQDVEALEDAANFENSNTTNTDDNLVIPSSNSKRVPASSHLRIISVENGDTCYDCLVRIGVVSNIRAAAGDDDDDPVALPSYISVLGITYSGSQRISVPTTLVVGKNAVLAAPDASPPVAARAAIASDPFPASLTLTPVDGDDSDDNFTMADITIVKIGGGNLVPCVGTGTEPGECGAAPAVILTAAPPDEDDASKGEKSLTFALAAADTTDDTDVTHVFREGEGAATTDGGYVDVVYTAEVGANPRNALLTSLRDGVASEEDKLPVIVAADGSRVAVTSANDDTTLDVEKKAPAFANPSPAPGSATGDEDQVISIDITDDDLAGVDTKTIMVHVRVGSATTKKDLVDNEKGNYKSASGSELDVEEIDGGVRVSVAIDEVSDGSLRIAADRTPTILWYVTADDNAKNSGTSDAVADNKDDSKTLGTQVYTFTVDGESTEIDRVYTGDWFNQATERVEGDRRLGANQYLPGSSDSTSIRVVFKDPVDGGSVAPEDFTVDGDAPSAAQWYDEGDTNPFESPDDSPITASVFLTVPAMAADATPTVAIVGSVSDMAGNTTTSGSKAASDGIAPSPTLSVDKTLSDEEVTVTVETDERIRTLTPELSLFVSNALDVGSTLNNTLDEVDTFRVSCETASQDAEKSATCTLALRQFADGVDPDGEGVVGESIASGDDLDKTKKIDIILSKGAIMDRNGDGDVETSDVEIGNQKNVPSTGSARNMEVVLDALVAPEGTDAEKAKIFDPGAGLVTVEVDSARDLVWGDQFTIRYRGVDPDSARGLASVPSGRQVSATSWTFALSIDRADKYAARATAEDANFNRGSGGIADPSDSGSTSFEIDNELAGGDAARTIPAHDSPGNNPVSITEPFFIELYWDGSEEDGYIAGNEGKEYPGDSSKTVTLAKAELDGNDVLDSAIRQTAGSWRIGVEDIGLGEHTLKYNAEDALGNTNETDRTLTFTVQPVPSWDLGLTAGMNLISLPSNPANGAVDAVFGDTEAIDLIFTFEGGQSRVALRNPDAPTTFVGTLTTIDAQHAYWISADNAATVEIAIPPTSQLAPPPYIAVKGGQWNLLPVMSLGAVDDDTKGEGAENGTKVDADAYLGDFRTAFGWTGRGWNKIDPDGPTTDSFNRLEEGPEVSVGMGYWVLYDEDSIITP